MGAGPLDAVGGWTLRGCTNRLSRRPAGAVASAGRAPSSAFRRSDHKACTPARALRAIMDNA